MTDPAAAASRDSIACAHCEKMIQNPKPTQRFCSMNCRVANHRQRGKSTEGEVTGIHPRKDGGCTVVVRVTQAFSARPKAWAPGQVVDLLERDL